MNSCSTHAYKSRQAEDGYVLLVLLLFVTLLSIGFLGMIQRIDFEIKRDREEEMIHRGVQYSRAVRKFINKFKRYPASIEELESSNNIRFLRKRYKDPITGKDFKLLHYSDMPSFISTMAAAKLASQQQAVRGASGSVTSPTGDPGTDSAEAQSSDESSQADGSKPTPDSQGVGSETGQSASNIPGTAPPPQPLSPRLGRNAAPQPGGGWIVGVASTSKEKSFRVFNKKDHYNQWMFIYDPSAGQAGLLTTPTQPPLAVVVQRNQQQSDENTPPPPSATNSGQTSTPIGSAQAPQ